MPEKYEFLLIQNNNGKVLKKYIFTLDEIIQGKANFANPDNIKVEIRQSAWLKDKNRKDIFWGDIVKVNNKLYIVDYYFQAFALKERETGNHFEYMCNLSDKMGGIYEIVGNIFEGINNEQV